MKIIGKTENGWLVEALPSELSRISSGIAEYCGGQLQIGLKIEVNKTWDLLTEIVKKSETYERKAKDLRSIAVALETLTSIKPPQE